MIQSFESIDEAITHFQEDENNYYDLIDGNINSIRDIRGLREKAQDIHQEIIKYIKIHNYLNAELHNINTLSRKEKVDIQNVLVSINHKLSFLEMKYSEILFQVTNVESNLSRKRDRIILSISVFMFFLGTVFSIFNTEMRLFFGCQKNKNSLIEKNDSMKNSIDSLNIFIIQHDDFFSK